MTTAECLRAVAEARLDSRTIEFDNCNPHWWFGFSPSLKFWMSYECCDSCNNGWFETYPTIEELQHELKNHLEDEWSNV